MWELHESEVIVLCHGKYGSNTEDVVNLPNISLEY